MRRTSCQETDLNEVSSRCGRTRRVLPGVHRYAARTLLVRGAPYSCLTSFTVESGHAADDIHAALDAGVRLLDTADAYCLNDSETGHNERLIAEALKTWKGDAGGVGVATKGGLVRPGGRWMPDGRAKHIRDACLASLRALDVPAIDLYQLHAVDPRVPLETSVRALAALQQEGRIRRIGLCR